MGASTLNGTRADYNYFFFFLGSFRYPFLQTPDQGGKRCMDHPLRIGQLKGHESRVFDARFGGTEGNCVASVGADKRLLLWRRDGPDHGNATWRKAATLTGAHDSEITRVEWHSSGGRVFSGGADGRVCIWDASLAAAESHAAGMPTRIPTVPMATLEASGEDEVYGLECLTPEMLLVGTSEVIQQWDIEQRTCTRSLALAPSAGAEVWGGSARNPDSKAFIFGVAARGRLAGAVLSDGTLRLVDAQECKQLFVLDAHESAAMSVCFSPTSQEFATTATDGEVALWDMRTLGRGPRLRMRTGEHSIYCCSWMRDSILVTGSGRQSLAALPTVSLFVTPRVCHTPCSPLITCICAQLHAAGR